MLSRKPTSEEQVEVTLASSSTTTDIFGQTTNNIVISGTSTINNFPNAPRAGMRRLCRFTGRLTLTHSANLMCLGDLNMTPDVGTTVEIMAVTTSSFRVLRVYDLSVKITNDGTALGWQASAYDRGSAIGVGSQGYNYGNATGRNANGSVFGNANGGDANGSGYGNANGYSANTNAMNCANANGFRSKCQRWNETWTCSDGAIINLTGFGIWQWFGNTTTVTPTELLLGGASNKRGILLANSAIAFDIDVLAATSAAGDSSMWNIKGLIKRGVSLDSTTIVGTPIVTLIAQDAGASTWAVSATADTVNGALALTVTGQAGVTIGWVATNKVFTERRF